jgi:hypothetical protein
MEHRRSLLHGAATKGVQCAAGCLKEVSQMSPERVARKRVVTDEP